MKRTFPLALAATLIAGALSGIQIPLSARAESVLPRSQESVTVDENNAALHLPESYEQYLPLENPSYVAMNEEYIAIADNSTIYIYDKSTNEYTPYHHEADDGQNTVSKIQFSDEGEMFFRDTGSHLYRYNFDTNDKEIIHDISCQTFLIQGDYLYYATETPMLTQSAFLYVPVNKDELLFQNANPLPEANKISAANPLIAFGGNTLYCIFTVNNDTEVWAYNGTTHERIDKFPLDAQRPVTNVQFACTYKNELFYTVKGALWRTDLSGTVELIPGSENYSTITSYGDKLYCIQGSVIREMEVTENSVTPTGYEISSNSSSPHRLSGAGETVRTKDLVAVADKGNNRISVYNRGENAYTVIPCEDEKVPFTPEHIAIGKEEVEVKTNGDIVTRNKIAVSNDDQIYEYTFERHTLKTEENGAHGPALYTVAQNVTGLSYVYGKCYYISEHDSYGILGDASTNGHTFNTALGSPDAITSDIYGTIYVAFGDKVYSFTEEDFKNDKANNAAEPLQLSSSSYKSLSVDYEGNVWHLSEAGELYCNNEKMATIDGNDFVYLKEEAEPKPDEHSYRYPVSFALSFEDDELYFNFENYVVKTNAYALEGLPSLNKITAGESKTKAFELADPSNLFVTVPAGSVGFEIALDELKKGESDYFPYESYFRLENEARRGVLLYEPQGEGYYVVALYNEALHTFTANLFHSSKNHLAPDTDYFAEANETAYVSSDVSLCSAPCLYPAPAGERLSTLSDALLNRGAKIRVLGYATGEDRTYAYVEVIDNARTADKGYIPRSYLTKNDPLGVEKDSYILGYLKGDAGIKLVSDDGKELEITEKTQAKLYKNEDGTYTAVVQKDGVVYKGTVNTDDIFRGATDAIRISLIVILSVLALVIIFGYVFLMFPRKKKKK